MRVIIVASCMICIVLALDPRIERAHEKRNRNEKERASLPPGIPILADPLETQTSYWADMAQETLKSKVNNPLNKNKAKNVIFFIGDGMSIPTLAVSRTHLGQRNGKPGEETVLSFEEFSSSGLVKTYCLDAQVPDSACTATAYLSGIKANEGTAGVNGHVTRGDCVASMDPATHVEGIPDWFQQAGRKTGYVTSSRVTHASPSPLFGHTAHRDWESDTDVINASFDPVDCPDLARQLIEGTSGQNLRVILGGGRGKFLPNSVNDISGPPGGRSDSRHLINEWIAQKSGAGVYVDDRTALLGVDYANTEYLMGLFGYSHMAFNLDATVDQPTLTEMTEAAIKTLENEDGYFLFVESGNIDYAHHLVQGVKALDETIELHKAVARAVELTNSEDTLILVSADHSHTMTYNGWPVRGNDVLGFAEMGDDGKPYSTISYANGETGFQKDPITGGRYDLTNDDLSDKDYLFPSFVPFFAETHGGDDVAIFCNGPWSHLCTGMFEQNLIPHIIAYAACVGSGATSCDCD